MGAVAMILRHNRVAEQNMLHRNFRILLASWTFSVSCFAADPFLGTWRLNLEKSHLTGQKIQIEALSGNTFRFTEDETSDEILADGLDHPTHFGETMSIKKIGPSSWDIDYKRAGKLYMDTQWVVSPDGQTLTYTAHGTRPSGQHFVNQLTAKRVSGGPGLAGTWESTSVKLSSPEQFQVQAFGADGYAFYFRDRKSTLRLKLDGKPYPELGPTVPDGFTSSGKRINDRTIELHNAIKKKEIEVERITISADGNTETLSVAEPGQKAVDFVYDRVGDTGK
jgi:hypothetical protein